ncbi:MAG: DUF4097 family beta strand repeat protein [Breznakibacter sp.]|nr:DUF4097 family beta strand repeat protein [Breznakibacter sp.]
MKKLFLITLLLPLLAVSAMAQSLADQVNKKFNNINKLVVEGSFCDVTINGSNSQEIDFNGEVYADATVKIKYEQNGSTLKIWLEKPSRISGRTKGKLAFVVPVNTNLEISTASGSISTDNIGQAALSFNAASGSIKLNNIRSTFAANTASGSIQAGNIKGDVKAGTASGSQSYTDIQGNLETKSASGSINIKNITGTVKASAASGSIAIAGGGNTINLNTASGSIKAMEINGNVTANTASGGVSLDNISGALNISTVSGGQQGTAITLTGNSFFKSVSGGIRINLSNSMEQIAFDLESVSGSLNAKGNSGKRKLQTGSGSIKVIGNSVSGSQSYN